MSSCFSLLFGLWHKRSRNPVLTYVRQSTSDIYVKLNIAALFHDLETEKEKRKKQVQTTEIYVDFNVCNMLLFFLGQLIRCASRLHTYSWRSGRAHSVNVRMKLPTSHRVRRLLENCPHVRTLISKLQHV